ncbi:hypothetical protein M2650_08995 [Luteimonas sp. SX5]|uniref:Uncharacterized protein n=1 Tax=Luteimonas galliterrae TaxID=2940486 RepID=A0ABT0MKI1_9GAMM|nr:hypothetical protein [Luteimonas galliterrae]MCL1634765.1 hypothetical protein [Luteimonas galliterrae]
MRAFLAAALFAAAAIAHAGDAKQYGQAIPQGEAVPISEAVAAHERYAGKPQRYSGRIVEVCQKEAVGWCWRTRAKAPA